MRRSQDLCLICVAGVNKSGDKSRLSATENLYTVCPVSKCGEDYWNSLDLSPILFTPPTRQDTLVLSMSVVWTRHHSHQEQEFINRINHNSNENCFHSLWHIWLKTKRCHGTLSITDRHHWTSHWTWRIIHTNLDTYSYINTQCLSRYKSQNVKLSDPNNEVNMNWVICPNHCKKDKVIPYSLPVYRQSVCN